MKAKKSFFNTQWFWLIIITVIGGFLRFYNLDWGNGHFFHPDEYHIAGAVDRLDFPTQMNPELFSYGSFTVYLIYFFKLFLNSIQSEFLTFHPIIIGRFFSAYFSTLSILVAFFLAKELFKKNWPVLLSTALVATTPGIIQQAHFATPESILTFWLMLTLWLWLRWIATRKTYMLFLSAVTLGLAAGTKIVAVTFLPLFLILQFSQFKLKPIKKIFAQIIKIVALLSMSLAAYFLVFPYSLLDQEGFFSTMRYETGLGRGDPLVFYTRQFIDTTPILFQLRNILPYALGPVILFFGSIGLILMIISVLSNFSRKKFKAAFQLVVFVFAFLCYFVPNVLLFAKWTRFLAPSFAFFPIFSVYFIFRLINFLKPNTNFRTVILVIISTFLTLNAIWTYMFFSIYLRPDLRIEATSWINKQLPANSFILTEAGNMLEAPLFGGMQKKSFDFYHLEEKQELRDQLPGLLFKSDYFIVQSRRIFYNHQRLAKYYPLTSRFYDLLFSESLGFKKIKTFTSYPQLNFLNWKVEIADEEAEETWSVFDHPVIRIYKRIYSLTEQDYEKILQL